ncbi:MAG: iolD [Aeromicrobium sp.]|uniref:3D-(3,5/4)-trihydroxycyclohexane-1,2-dione acylhydrolase (decyclizing) n=1 Tax=Aeromicrobium sp. TaxID=1871063 RepID=UPI0026196FF5|nr:3D-(3,5/4)-trihydroxycyclohexane-1,2-dione acylhydrolase (decyclizing) [Aeromicrobium sp.]MCW2825272.1 iolD [Aeromicrobium sp.]
MTVLTVAQATVRFLEAQFTERDGIERPFFAGCWGIFGHGNVAGVGQALLEREQSGDPSHLRFFHGRNEQAMVHAAVAYARQRDRLAAMAVTASVGPGATNMVTGAALATINRLPVLLLPGDTFATRVASPVLQELESAQQGDISVNDVFRPVSVHFDRVDRPEQLASALLHATRILTDPAETGAVTLALPQDVQAESYDFPDDLFARRVWHVARPVPEPAALERAVAVIRSARRPLVVAGGGVAYSQANDALQAFVEATGIPVGESQAGKGSLAYDHPQSVGAIGATGTAAANALAEEADVVIGVGTRYSDFTTASRTAFQADGVRFVNLNVSAFDTHKHSATGLVADAREGLTALTAALEGWRADEAYTARATELAGEWDAIVQRAYDGEGAPQVADGLAIQSQVIGAVNELSGPRDVVVCAAGSMPGDLHKLWRTRDRKGYHVEYGFSCMGYEIAGGLGVKMAALDEDDDRDVFVMVGDGSYLMMNTELVTAVAEGVKVIVVLVQNHGYASIGALSQSLGSQRFGTSYRYRTDSGLDGDKLPVDLAANAASLGADVLSVAGIEDFRAAVLKAKESTRTTVIHVETDPLVPAPDSPAWWDVPVSEVSVLESTQQARLAYEDHKTRQRAYLAPASDETPHERGNA